MSERSSSSESPAQADWSVYPLRLANGERPLIFTHAQYRRVRRAARLEEYDMLMLRPEEELVTGEKDLREDERWQPVAAKKYLKHRAMEWREAEELSELPERWRVQAEELEAALERGAPADLPGAEATRQWERE